MRTVFRLLLVWLLIAVLPVKGIAAVAMLACGSHHPGAAPAVQAPAGLPGPGHAAHPSAPALGSHHGAHGGGHASHGGVPASHHRAQASQHGPHASHPGAHPSQADTPAGSGPAAVVGAPGAAGGDDTGPPDVGLPDVTHKCSACAACGAGAALPADPPGFALPEVGPAHFTALPPSAVHFVTDGPDRPPRTFLA